MIRAFQMVFSPEAVWPKIAEKNRHMIFILFLSSLPLIVGCLAVEGFGIDRFGESAGELGMRYNPERILIYKYFVVHLEGDFIFMFLGAYFLQSVGRSFNSNP